MLEQLRIVNTAINPQMITPKDEQDIRFVYQFLESNPNIALSSVCPGSGFSDERLDSLITTCVGICMLAGYASWYAGGNPLIPFPLLRRKCHKEAIAHVPIVFRKVTD